MEHPSVPVSIAIEASPISMPGKFVNLIDFLQCLGFSVSQTELEPIVTDTGELRFKPKTHKSLTAGLKCIQTSCSW